MKFNVRRAALGAIIGGVATVVIGICPSALFWGKSQNLVGALFTGIFYSVVFSPFGAVGGAWSAIGQSKTWMRAGISGLVASTIFGIILCVFCFFFFRDRMGGALGEGAFFMFVMPFIVLAALILGFIGGAVTRGLMNSEPGPSHSL